MPYNIPAVIFAGGKSSRMGRDKALLPFGSYRTLSEFQYEKLNKYFQTVYISAKKNKFNFDCQIIEDIYKINSPLVAIISIFETLKCDSIFVLSVDTPLINKQVIKKLWEKKQYLEKRNYPFDAIIAKSPDGVQPLCGIYKQSILPLAHTYLSKNKHKLMAILKESSMYVVTFQDNKLFTNLNTPDQYKKLLIS